MHYAGSAYAWLPLGILIAIVRLLVDLLPYSLIPMACATTGFHIRAQLLPASPANSTSKLYVCSHRTLLDPVIISVALHHSVSAVTYSVSMLSELISPIPTTRLTRDRAHDAEAMRSALRNRDLVVCPEGATCREPYLLRFSPLFTEINQDIVTATGTAEGSMFYGTTVRGHKCFDSFFLVNPRPLYQMLFLDHHCHSTSNSYEVANMIQKSIGDALVSSART